MRLNSTASPDVTPLGWVSLQKHFSHLPCNLVIYILSVRETINSVMEGLYLSYLCILVPYHKSWPLVVAQQEQAFLTHSFIGSGLTLLVIMSKIWVVGSAWDVLCVLSLSPVQLFRDSMNCSPPGASVHGITLTRILECAAISSSIHDHQSSSDFFCHLKLYHCCHNQNTKKLSQPES